MNTLPKILRYSSLAIALSVSGVVYGCSSTTKEIDYVPAPAPIVQVAPPIVEVPAPVVVSSPPPVVEVPAPVVVASPATSQTTTTSWGNGTVEQKKTTRTDEGTLEHQTTTTWHEGNPTSQTITTTTTSQENR